MRCIAGFALFVILYFSGCIILGGVARELAIANDAGHSPAVGRAAEYEAKRKYHALVAVGAGIAPLLACSLPTILAKRSRQGDWEQAEWDKLQGNR